MAAFTAFPYWEKSDVVDPVSGQNNVVAPSAGKQDSGWDFDEQPPRQYFNWLARLTYQGFEYFAARVDQDLTIGSDPEFGTVSMDQIEDASAAGLVIAISGGNALTLNADNITIAGAPATERLNLKDDVLFDNDTDHTVYVRATASVSTVGRDFEMRAGTAGVGAIGGSFTIKSGQGNGSGTPGQYKSGDINIESVDAVDNGGRGDVNVTAKEVNVTADKATITGDGEITGGVKTGGAEILKTYTFSAGCDNGAMPIETITIPSIDRSKVRSLTSVGYHVSNGKVYEKQTGNFYTYAEITSATTVDINWDGANYDDGDVDSVSVTIVVAQ